MPVSVVVGGQFGSEGKGKVALHIARSSMATAVVRVGGPNSGHTAVDDDGKAWTLRQLPAAALARDTLIVLPAGSLIDPDLLLAEVACLNVDQSRLIIDAKASTILPYHRDSESKERLVERIGSTGSGTGAALRERISRTEPHLLAKDHPQLRPYVHKSCSEYLREILAQDDRVVIEGTQGFGLSVWHGGHYPYATSRDTTAAGFLSETGLAPHDVDDVVLVLRSFPIRVGGNSGPLPNEIDWPTLANEAGLPSDYKELTSATHRIRRVARFDPTVVRQAITANAPHRIVMNHVDYVEPGARTLGLGSKSLSFIGAIEALIGRQIDLAGLSPSLLVEVHPSRLRAAI